MNRKIVILYTLLICLLKNTFAHGQEPYHFFLGEDIFATVNIYGINQDPNGIYWFTSDAGLFSYDGYEFQKYDNPELLGNSLFNPTIGPDSLLYCNNLNGQIFRVNNGNMELHYTVPDSLLGAYTNFEFLADKSLLVYSNNRFFTTDGKLGKKKLRNRFHHAVSTSYNDKKLLQVGYDQIAVFDQNMKFEKDILVDKNFDFIRTFQGKLFCNHINTSVLYLKPSSDSTMESIPIDQNVDLVKPVTSDSSLWVLDNDAGVHEYQLTETIEGLPQFQHKKEIMKGTFISYMFEDKQGNLLLGTFKQGIIVIPKTGIIQDIVQHLKLTEIEAMEDGQILLGDYLGNIYKMGQAPPKLIANVGEGQILALRYFPNRQDILFSSGRMFTAQETSSPKRVYRMGSLKDVATHPSYDGYLLSSNTGIGLLEYGHYAETASFREITRTYTVAFQHDTSIVVGTSKGLAFMKDFNAPIEFLTYQHRKVISPHILALDTMTLIGTNKYGILKLKDKKLTPFIDQTTGLASNHVLQLQAKGNYLYVSSEMGFQIFDMKGNLSRTLGNSDGLESSKVSDFVVNDQYLWILNKSSLNKIPIDLLTKKATTSTIQSIQLFSQNQRLGTNQLLNIPFDKNKITLKIYAPSLAKMKDLRYEYFLENIDLDTISQEYLDNTVTYNALPPGKYTFKANLFLHEELQDSKTISFSIAKPYWLTWWFWSSIALVATIVFIALLRYRLVRIKQRANELEELYTNKMNALQNQLNPHFIFNAIQSIQSFILDDNTAKANSYLGNFAHLMRQVLENSREQFIYLEDEISLITNYLNIQKEHSGIDFQYEIKLAHDIDAYEILIPPMFIQPFLENALEHGLTHDKMGQIHISFQLDMELFCIEITDNGVGFDGTHSSDEQHQSLALSIIKERIRSYQKQLGVASSLAIAKIYEGESVLGTRINVRLPYKIE